MIQERPRASLVALASGPVETVEVGVLDGIEERRPFRCIPDGIRI